MPFTYTYRPEMGITNSLPMREYDHKYQITPEGQGIAWLPGMVWPSIIQETATRRHIGVEISAAADGIVARIMMRTKVEWESRHGNS